MSSENLLVAVTGSQVPYIFDLPHVLSLPTGFEFRFRYSPQWVSADVQREIDDEQTAKRLVGSDLLLLFHSEELGRLVPVRRCTVLSVERLGPLIFLRFKVGAFAAVSSSITLDPPLESEIAAESARLAGLGVKLLDCGERDLTGRLPEGRYLFRAKHKLTDVPWSASASDRGWSALVAILMNEPHLRGLPFFYLLGFQKRSGALAVPSPLKGSFTVSTHKINGFELIHGERYRLRLLEWRSQKEPLYRVLCEVSPGALLVEGRTDLVVGRYDALEFAIMAVSKGYSEVFLSAEPARQSGAEPHQDGSRPAELMAGTAIGRPKAGDAAGGRPSVYTARVPVHVRGNRLKTFYKWLAATFGFVFYAASVPIAKFVLQWPAHLFSFAIPSPDLAAKGIQLLGLAMMTFAFADFLERALGTGEKLKGFSSGGTDTAAK